MSHVTIPWPCAESWAAMTASAAGRYCATCATEVVDFTSMSTDEVLAYLAARPGQRICGRMRAPVVQPRHQKRQRGLRRWLVAAATFLGWQLAVSCAVRPVPTALAVADGQPARPIVIRGQVQDDSLHNNLPLGGVKVFIAGTEYGTVTDAQGNFTLTLPADWPPVAASIKSGVLNLYIPHIAFATLDQEVPVNINAAPELPTQLIRLRSIPERGYVKGKAVVVPSPRPLKELFGKRR